MGYISHWLVVAAGIDQSVVAAGKWRGSLLKRQKDVESLSDGGLTQGQSPVDENEKLDTKFQAIRLAAGHFLAHAVPQIQP